MTSTARLYLNAVDQYPMEAERIPPMKRKNHSLRKRFAAGLRAAREAQGLTQEALAHEAGLHRTFVGSVERGERNISIDNMQRLARALGVDAIELMRR